MATLCNEAKKRRICRLLEEQKCGHLNQSSLVSCKKGYLNESEGWKGVNQVQFSSSSVPQSCPTPYDPINCSMPGFPVHHKLPGLAQTHVHQVGDASQCHPTISSSVIPFFSCLQSFIASRSFQMSQLFASGGQIIRVSASTSVPPMNNQDWSPSGWTGWISLQSKGLSRVFSNTTVQKHQFFDTQFSL